MKTVAVFGFATLVLFCSGCIHTNRQYEMELQQLQARQMALDIELDNLKVEAERCKAMARKVYYPVYFR